MLTRFPSHFVIKITKNDIIKTALDLIRKNGTDAINARSIALSLNCSTQPIFSNFATMEELENAVISAAYEHYFTFLKSEVESKKYPQYKAFGMAYIRFAKDEKELFKLLFMRNRQGEHFSPTADFNDSVEIIMKANGISRKKATLMHFEMWTCVHGIATMVATSFLDIEWTLIENILSDIYQGTRSIHLKEEQ